MSIEEQLKEYIITNRTSINSFAKEIGMAYGTISGVFIRGINNSSMKTLIPICNELDISIDELSNGKIVRNTRPISNYDFNNENDISIIMNELKSYICDCPMVTLNGEPISKNTLDGILKTFDITLRTYQEK